MNGLIRQWGKVSYSSGNNTQYVSLLDYTSTDSYECFATPSSTAYNSDQNTGWNISPNTPTQIKINTQFEVASGTLYWLTIGY